MSWTPARAGVTESASYVSIRNPQSAILRTTIFKRMRMPGYSHGHAKHGTLRFGMADRFTGEVPVDLKDPPRPAPVHQVREGVSADQPIQIPLSLVSVAQPGEEAAFPGVAPPEAATCRSMVQHLTTTAGNLNPSRESSQGPHERRMRPEPGAAGRDDGLRLPLLREEAPRELLVGCLAEIRRVNSPGQLHVVQVVVLRILRAHPLYGGLLQPLLPNVARGPASFSWLRGDIAAGQTRIAVLPNSSPPQLSGFAIHFLAVIEPASKT